MKKGKKSFYNDNCMLKVKDKKMVLIEKAGWVRTYEQSPLRVKYNNPSRNRCWN